MSSNKIEFAVQMSCDSCVDSVKKSLANIRGVKSVEVNLERNSVVVDTTSPTLEIQERLESTGKKVVVRGYAGSLAAVSILDITEGEGNVQGVVRFTQVSPNSCIIDGTLDGLTPISTNHLEIHECGDISNGCKSVGDVYGQLGNLGEISADPNGRSVFRRKNSQLRLSEVIGRSLVVRNDTGSMACGIIARSAGLFANPKTICACDGVSIWDERNK